MTTRWLRRIDFLNDENTESATATCSARKDHDDEKATMAITARHHFLIMAEAKNGVVVMVVDVVVMHSAQKFRTRAQTAYRTGAFPHAC